MVENTPVHSLVLSGEWQGENLKIKAHSTRCYLEAEQPRPLYQGGFDEEPFSPVKEGFAARAMAFSKSVRLAETLFQNRGLALETSEGQISIKSYKQLPETKNEAGCFEFEMLSEFSLEMENTPKILDISIGSIEIAIYPEVTIESCGEEFSIATAKALQVLWTRMDRGIDGFEDFDSWYPEGYASHLRTHFNNLVIYRDHLDNQCSNVKVSVLIDHGFSSSDHILRQLSSVRHQWNDVLQDSTALILGSSKRLSGVKAGLEIYGNIYQNFSPSRCFVLDIETGDGKSIRLTERILRHPSLSVVFPIKISPKKLCDTTRLPPGQADSRASDMKIALKIVGFEP